MLLYLILSIIKYGSRVSGVIQEKMQLPLQHLTVVPIEKGTFESPSTTVSLLTNRPVGTVVECSPMDQDA